MQDRAIAKATEHTILAPDATNEDIRAACALAIERGCGALAVNGSNVKFASILTNRTPIVVSAMIGGFPLGRVPIAIKTLEALEAIKLGAQELELMINIGAFKECSPDYLLREVRETVAAADGRLVKVILETGYLTDPLKIKAGLIAADAGANCISIGTGFGPVVDLVHDVELLRGCLPQHVGIKASGGIDTLETARELLAAGAARLGVTNTATILTTLSDIQTE